MEVPPLQTAPVSRGEDIFSPFFAPWSLSSEGLFSSCARMFQELDLTTRSQISDDTLSNFLQILQDHYFEIPFHSFVHAMDTAQAMFYMLKVARCRLLFSPLETFALFVAAICHDVGHPGTSPDFHIRAQTDLAVLYNDRSVLENHHASVGWRLINSMEPSIIDSLSASERTVFRDYFVTTILATDLAKHGHLMDSFRDLLPEISSCLPLTADSHSLASTKAAIKPSSSDPPPQPSMQRRLSASNFDISFLRPQRKRLAGRRYSVDAAHEMVRPSVEWWGSNDGARRLMACMLMKSADLVGVARSWETARYVAQCYFLEVQSQIPKEIAAGLTPSASEPACKDTHIAKTQLGFIHAIPEPLWQAVSQAVPSLSAFCHNISSNLAQWTTVLKLLANPACAA